MRICSRLKCKLNEIFHAHFTHTLMFKNDSPIGDEQAINSGHLFGLSWQVGEIAEIVREFPD